MAKYRKIIRTGNSLAITIPSRTINDFSLKEGDIALVKINKTKTSITYTFSGHPRQLSLIDKSKRKS